MPPTGRPRAILGILSSNLSVIVTLILTDSDRLLRTLTVLTATLYVPSSIPSIFHVLCLASEIRIGFSKPGKSCVISKPNKCSYSPGRSPTLVGATQDTNNSSPTCPFLGRVVEKTSKGGGTISSEVTVG